MKTFSIFNHKNNTKYEKDFIDNGEARHWIINNLDLSLDWSMVSKHHCTYIKDRNSTRKYICSCGDSYTPAT